jgi:hypothetical protein
MEGNQMGHPVELMVDFTSPCGAFTLTFDDDGKVAYAYMRKGKAILGDVWLYNRCETPDRSEWSDRSKLPFANCTGYMKDEGRVQEPVSLEDVTAEWEYTGERPKAFVYLFGDLVASVSEGEKPGYSRFASRDGPLAKRMVLEERD